ncbi:uncharacterized protein cd79b [Clinocottus analis]|uniref:uncharacterized protein cd79b n=1 Tax=Clinocottus analis TaxID=304258 RepID=UPI0035C2524B
MRWLLAGCCGLALISISVAPDPAVPITQKPRFFGVRTKSTVIFCCWSVQRFLPAEVEWFRTDRYREDGRDRRQILEDGRRFEFFNTHPNQKFLVVRDTRIEDSGVYYCKLNDTWGPGTELQVARDIDLPQALHRSAMKDWLIVLQGLLLAACVAAMMMRKRHLFKKQDSLYEEPETDHIYEGLAIEKGGEDLYEELSPYEKVEVVEGAEAPWE